jgi:hypothetical protein
MAASLAELQAGAPPGGDADYGAGALAACDRLVRIYQAEGIEVQAPQGLDLVVERGELTALGGRPAAPRPCGRTAKTVRPSGTPSSTPCLTGRAGFSSRAT